MVDATVLLGFLLVTCFVFAAAAVILLGSVFHYLHRKSICSRLLEKLHIVRPEEIEPWFVSSKRTRWTILFLAAVISLCGLYGMLIEATELKIEHVRFLSKKLSPETGKIRLVFISDAHSDKHPRLEVRLPSEIKRLSPDIIIFGGDAVNSSDAVPVFKNMMASLAQIAPTYFVNGNWDAWWFSNTDLYSGTGAMILNNRLEKLAFRTTPLQLIGYGVEQGHNALDYKWNRARVQQLLQSTQKDQLVVFVHHFPEVGAIAAASGADITLSGDTHGGQVRLPFIGPIVRISRFGTYIDSGPHYYNTSLLYVARGLGMEGGTAPRLRFRCPPELTVIDIEPEQVPSH
jgi:uncharacterized protein